MSTGKVFVEICVAGSDLFEGDIPIELAYDLPKIARGEMMASNENVYKCKVCGEWHNERLECVDVPPEPGTVAEPGMIGPLTDRIVALETIVRGRIDALEKRQEILIDGLIDIVRQVRPTREEIHNINREGTA